MMRRVMLSLAVCGAAVGLGVGGSGLSVHAKDSVTFSEDIAPIVFNNCTSCHRPVRRPRSR
jgi:hypothetical protein